MVVLLSGRTIFLLINLVCYLICNFEISKGGCVFAGSVCFVLSIGGCFVCGEYVIKIQKQKKVRNHFLCFAKKTHPRSDINWR